jgi:hypothetical protein
MTLDIEPNAKMIGSDGLRIAYLSEPADIMTIKADGAITHLGSERTTGRVEASVRAIPPGIQLIMLLEGTATSPDGTRRRHSERIAIPQKRAETGKT